MMADFKIHWIDRDRDPKYPPDPAYPNGIDIDCSKGQSPSCKSALKYPARRCGMYFVECNVCGTYAVITTAGRIDDPRSVTLACDPKPGDLDHR